MNVALYLQLNDDWKNKVSKSSRGTFSVLGDVQVTSESNQARLVFHTIFNPNPLIGCFSLFRKTLLSCFSFLYAHVVYFVSKNKHLALLNNCHVIPDASTAVVASATSTLW